MEITYSEIDVGRDFRIWNRNQIRASLEVDALKRAKLNAVAKEAGLIFNTILDWNSSTIEDNEN